MKKVSIVLASMLIAACATSTKPASGQLATSNKGDGSPAVTSSTIAAQIDLSALNDAIHRLEQQSDYFDYNKAVIKPQYLPILQKEAEFLKSHHQDVVTLEGNADERGGERYNLTLGHQRAEAVRTRLQAFGVPAAQLKTVSYGKDKPRLSCHEEKCWKENRRVDFKHQLG
jgi:peptidoglycan-associated lipoprotein